MASEEDLAASLQRSQSTPEPLFGQPDLELKKFSSRQHSNGKTLKEGQHCFNKFFSQILQGVISRNETLKYKNSKGCGQDNL